MLTRPEMAVVFVPDETISLGNDIYILTAVKYSKCSHMSKLTIKCHRDELQKK